MTWLQAAAQELPADEEIYVLHGRPLRPGAQLGQTARLTDDIWPLNAAILQLHVLACCRQWHQHRTDQAGTRGAATASDWPKRATTGFWAAASSTP